MSSAHAGQATPCESARVALDASIHHLVVEIGIFGINCANDSLSQEQNMACRQYTDTLTALNTCEERQGIGSAYQRLLNRGAALPLQAREFTDALRIGMTALEINAAERESFGSPVEKTVNTTITANGTNQQWLYRFSRYAKATGDVYVYLHDGVVSAIQK
jgi:hypothetical protein